jgi:hypothetical protein
MDSRRKRRFGFVIALVMILSGGGAFVLPETYLGHDPARWVEANAHALPTTLADISSYPVTYRKAIFASLPPDTRRSLWQEQLRRHIDSHPKLEISKRQFLERLIVTLTQVEFGVRNAGAEPPAALKAACSEAASILTGDEKALLSTLGPSLPTFASLESKRLRLAFSLSDLVTLNASRIPDCECHKTSWCSCDDCTTVLCYGSEEGCGCFWVWPCNGGCPI